MTPLIPVQAMPIDISEPKIAAAIVAASVSLTIFLITKVVEIVVAYRERRRSDFAQLMGIRSELEINLEIAKALLSSADVPRTLGFRFVDDIWKATDRSVLYLYNNLAPDVHKAYATIVRFHLLAERRAAIRDKGNKYPNAEKVISIERNEMIELAKSIQTDIPIALKKFPK